jgi:hypothetical protein
MVKIPTAADLRLAQTSNKFKNLSTTSKDQLHATPVGNWKIKDKQAKDKYTIGVLIFMLTETWN